MSLILLALAAAEPAYAAYPLKLDDGPWHPDWVEWWEDADNGFRWATGSITTANQLMRADVKLTRRKGPVTVRFEHNHLSDLISHIAYDPDSPRSDYGVFRADWLAKEPWYLSALARMNYYKSRGSAGAGAGYAFPSGADAHLVVMAQGFANAMAKEEFAEHPARKLEYPYPPFELFGRFRGSLTERTLLTAEATYLRTEWRETTALAVPALVNQRLFAEEALLKLRAWHRRPLGPIAASARLLAELRHERFEPLALYRLRSSPDVHFGEAAPYHVDLLFRGDYRHALRAELQGWTGFLQRKSTEYLLARRDVLGGKFRLEWMFTRPFGLSAEVGYERGTGRYAQPPILWHAEQFILPLSDSFRGVLEMNYYFELDGATRRSWNLTRYEVMWTF